LSNAANKGDTLILGATGVVGRELLQILANRNFPADRLRLVASDDSLGASIDYLGRSLRLERLEPSVFDHVGLVFSVAPSSVAAEWVPRAVEAGAAVIDNSSRFRHDPGVPLIVPEINGGEISQLDPPPRLIANPNCSTILLLLAIHPLQLRFGLRAVDVSTYQAVSGAGWKGMEQLRRQTADALADQPIIEGVFPQPIAFNVFSHESEMDPETGLNGEEQKIISEARRILGEPSLSITPTCVRVPVFRAHSQSVTVLLDLPASLREMSDALGDAPGVRLVDDRRRQRFPTPLSASHQDEVLVGRLRPDPSDHIHGRDQYRRWCLFLSGDQLRKGAALNAVQIADLCGWWTQAHVVPNNIAANPRSPSNVLTPNGSPATRQAISPATSNE
jgi:aspartate-semialdehyde dehydrogenase